MTSIPPSNEVFIRGVTRDGRSFRPSDWAERLAGVMAQFRPGGAQGPGSHLGYSPWCVPTTFDGAKCVVVNRALREHEPMAWDFVMNFARDNELQVLEACLLPEPGAAPAGKPA
ncbi:MAG: DUF3579 domain-containing protein [Proteobacteria bacterium]|jgi:hypothetical protein|nr:DUF3579 domain-containing protein [Pseudomonadota bacterium]